MLQSPASLCSAVLDLNVTAHGACIATASLQPPPPATPTPETPTPGDPTPKTLTPETLPPAATLVFTGPYPCCELRSSLMGPVKTGMRGRLGQAPIWA